MSSESEPVSPPEYKGFDLVFHHVGGKGIYQWRLLGVVSLQMMFLTLHHLGFVFLGAVPKHWCSVEPLSETGWSLEQIRNFSIPLQQNVDEAVDGPQWDECVYYDRNYTYIKETGMSYEAALVAFPSTEVSETIECKSWIYDKSIYASTVVSSFDLVCEKRYMVATIQSSYMGGILVGSLVLATLSDKIFGRRVITLVSIGMVLVAGTGAAFAPDYYSFVALRFLLATGVAGSYQNCYVLLLEYADPSYRALLGVIEQLPFAFGCMLIPAFAYFIRNWSDLQLAFTLSAVTLISYIWILPDSSRWLASKGRTDDALKILEKVARVNRKPKPNLKVLQEILESCRDSEISDNQEFGVMRSIKESIKNFLALVRTPKLRYRSLSLWCLYFAVTVVYYGLSFGSVRLSSDPYILFFLSGLMDVPAYCGITVPLVSRLGRKPVIIVSFFIAGASLFGLTFTPSDMTNMRIALALCGKLFIACAFAIIYLLGAELYPTTMRTTGLGAAVMIGRFGSMTAPYFVDIKGSSVMSNLPILLFGIVSLVAAFVGFTLPETKETVMPDNIDDVENDCDSGTCGHVPLPMHISDFNRLAPPSRERTVSE